jgi:tetratricopeptide (TPR) repeat protein
MAQAADFFVSYTSKDRAWAEWIAWQLEAEGYQVVVEAWDFRPGRDFVQQMHQVVEEAKRTIAVLSPAYLNSGFAGTEWQAVFAKDPTGERGLLLPVRVEEVEPPGLLRTRIYVDLVGKNTADARAALLAAARDARGKPAKEPALPGARAVPRFPGELPPVWNVPYHPNRFFIGRDLLLAEVHSRLSASELAVRRVALTGLGGVGKTQLAAEYAYQQQADYDLVWWARAEQLTSVLGDYAALAGQPPLVGQLRLAEDAPQEVAVAAVRSWLEQHPRWLLLLDNADDPATVAELLPRSGTGQVVITSRAGVGWERLAMPLPVEVLAPGDAADFLLARTGEAGPAAEAAAATLATTLGGLPLALEQAGAYITATGTITLAGYVELFATRALELLKRGELLDYQRTVATTWSLALQRLQEAEPAAVGLLTLAAFLAPDDLPLPLLAAHSEELPDPLAAAAGDPLALADAVAALRRYSLVRVNADALSVHRLMQVVVRGALDGESERGWAVGAIRLLHAGFPHDSGVAGNWPECERLLPHVLAVADYAQRLEVESQAWLWLLKRAGMYLWRRGRYRQALEVDELTLAASQRMLGDDHPVTLTSMYNLADTYRHLSRLEEARQLHEQTLAARRRVLGDDDPDTLASMNNLAETYRHLHRLDEALKLHQQTLAARRRVLGDDDRDTLASMNNLAETYRHLHRLEEARQLHEQTLAARRRVLRPDDPDTLKSMDNLAETRHDIADLQGARELHEQTLAARRRVLRDDHPDTLRSMNNLGMTLADLGELHDAQDLLEQAVTGRRRVLGDDHPDTLISMNNLAEIRRPLGDLEGACKLYEQTLAARRRVRGDDHPDTLNSMNNLAVVRRELGEP